MPRRPVRAAELAEAAAPPAAPPWVVVRALCITQILGWAALYFAISVLAPAIAADTGWRRDAVMGGFTLALLAQAAAALPAGLAVDRFGGRTVMAAGSLLATLGLGVLAAAPTLSVFSLGWLLSGLAMAATLYEPAFATITAAFGPHARRGITVLTLAGGFAGTVGFPVSLWLLQRFGWRAAFGTWAAVQLLVCLPLHWHLLPGAPSGTGTRRGRSRLGPVLRAPAFWFATLALALNGLLFTAMSVHAIPLLQEKGFSAEGAVGLASLTGPVQVVGRLMEFGPMGRLRPARVAILCAALLPVALLCLLGAGAAWWLGLVYVVLYGGAIGVMTIVRGALPADLFGREGYGGIAGALAVPAMLCRAVAPFAAAFAWTIFGGYDLVLWVLVAAGVGSMLAFILAARARAAP